MILAAGCSDDPNSVGSGLLPPADSVKIFSKEVFATSSSNYLQRISGNRTRLLVGKNPSYEAVTLLKFSGITQLQPSDTIVKAELKFSVTYRFPDTAGFFNMEARRFLRGFSQSTFTWDSLQSGDVGDTVGTLSTMLITPSDSILSLPLRKDYVQQITDSSSALIHLSSTAAAQLIIGLDNYEDYLFYNGPKLVIAVYDSSLDSIVTITYNASQQMFVANDNISVPAQRLFVQSGVSRRAIVKFNVSSIKSSASITQATMVVRLDSALSLRGSFATNLLYANLLLDSLSPPKISSLSTSATLSSDSLGPVLKFDVKNIVQQWVTGHTNYGVVLRPLEEYVALDRYVLYGANADTLRRPKLFVTYTVVP